MLLFGQVRDGRMRCNRAGNVVWSAWRELPLRFPSVELGEFVVMPNHVHGILVLTPRKVPLSAMAAHRAGRASPAPTRTAASPSYGIVPAEHGSLASPVRLRAPSVSDIIGAFKSLASIEVNRVLDRAGTPVWQRNFYEHILRGSEDVVAVREYILKNPGQWSTDRQNPGVRLFRGDSDPPLASWLR